MHSYVDTDKAAGMQSRAIGMPTGELKGITLDQETITEWLSAIPIGAYICHTIELIHEEDKPIENEVLRKEER